MTQIRRRVENPDGTEHYERVTPRMLEEEKAWSDRFFAALRAISRNPARRKRFLLVVSVAPGLILGLLTWSAIRAFAGVITGLFFVWGHYILLVWHISAETRYQTGVRPRQKKNKPTCPEPPRRASSK